MILYNVTANVDPSVHDDWLQYMKNQHIADVMATQCFTENRFFKILSTQFEGELSYSIQYLCHDMHMLHEYQQKHAPRLQAEHSTKFGDKVLAFRTILETV